MSIVRNIQPKAATQIEEPAIAKFLFADTRMAWFWLIVRLYVGWQWLVAGTEKLTGYNIDFGHWADKATCRWVFSAHDGLGLTFFVKSAIAQTAGAHPAVQGWYASFLQTFVLPYTGFWAYVVTFGEILVGLGLIFGVLTGIAAFFGVFMNMNFMLAGAVSINPIIGGLALFLVLAWRIAGYWGADRYLLPLLGTPWTGSLARKTKSPPVTAAPAV
jgi:thiosulfate dehydrogenase [quinone] large subunit